MSRNVAFVIEQVLGHITHAENLRRHLSSQEEFDAHWVLPTFETGKVGSRIPLYRSNWTVRAGLASRRAVRRLFKSDGIDAMFVHTQVPAMLMPDMLKKVPTIVSVDATPHQYDELGDFYDHEVGSGAVESVKDRAARLVFARATKVVAWSEWAAKGLVDDYAVDRERVEVIPPGVTVSEWRRPEPRESSSEPPRFLFVGGDFERKGGSILLEAFATLSGLGAELHIATRDDVTETEGVHVHHGLQPNSEELRALYHRCDIFVLPTSGDCLPMVLSEAGAASMAVISTDIAGIPEIVRDGDTGLLVPPGDAVALAVAMRRLAEDPDERLRFGARAQEHVSEHFDSEANAHRLVELIAETSRAGSQR